MDCTAFCANQSLPDVGPASSPSKSSGTGMKSRLSAEMVISLPCSQPMQNGRRGVARAAACRNGCDSAYRDLYSVAATIQIARP